jgi:hypothetical protein
MCMPSNWTVLKHYTLAGIAYAVQSFHQKSGHYNYPRLFSLPTTNFMPVSPHPVLPHCQLLAGEVLVYSYALANQHRLAFCVRERLYCTAATVSLAPRATRHKHHAPPDLLSLGHTTNHAASRVISPTAATPSLPEAAAARSSAHRRLRRASRRHQWWTHTPAASRELCGRVCHEEARAVLSEHVDARRGPCP